MFSWTRPLKKACNLLVFQSSLFIICFTTPIYLKQAAKRSVTCFLTLQALVLGCRDFLSQEQLLQTELKMVKLNAD